jgi:hypothetical protein
VTEVAADLLESYGDSGDVNTASNDALHCGLVDVPRLRRVLAGLPRSEAADGRLVLAVDVTHWLRPDAPTSSDRLFCHPATRYDVGKAARRPETIAERDHAGPLRSDPGHVSGARQKTAP